MTRSRLRLLRTGEGLVGTKHMSLQLPTAMRMSNRRRWLRVKSRQPPKEALASTIISAWVPEQTSTTSANRNASVIATFVTGNAKSNGSKRDRKGLGRWMVSADQARSHLHAFPLHPSERDIGLPETHMRRSVIVLHVCTNLVGLMIARFNTAHHVPQHPDPAPGLSRPAAPSRIPPAQARARNIIHASTNRGLGHRFRISFTRPTWTRTWLRKMPDTVGRIPAGEYQTCIRIRIRGSAREVTWKET